MWLKELLAWLHRKGRIQGTTQNPNAQPTCITRGVSTTCMDTRVGTNKDCDGHPSRRISVELKGFTSKPGLPAMLPLQGSLQGCCCGLGPASLPFICSSSQLQPPLPSIPVSGPLHLLSLLLGFILPHFLSL